MSYVWDRHSTREWRVLTLGRTPVAMIDKEGNSFTGWNGYKFTIAEGQKYATLNEFLGVYRLKALTDVNFRAEIWEVCYNVGNGRFSVNMIEGTKAEALEIADRKCAQFGYTLDYIKQISRTQADSYRMKGMPYFKC